ncbi:hypothetical protein [Rhizobium beringeri]|uniref:hypothetical protein n=1 Tax=Rhizobium beringeri TaxID=3019934 RepID=UPI003B58CBC9
MKVYGAGAVVWAKTWRQITSHLAQAASGSGCQSGAIIAHGLTDQKTDDPSQGAPLLDQIDGSRSTSSRPTEPMTAKPNLSVYPAAQRNREHRHSTAFTRWKAVIPDRLVKGTSTLPQSQATVG